MTFYPYSFKMFSTTKFTVFLASVIVACIGTVSAADSVFFSAPNCAGTQLQTVNYTPGLCRLLVTLNEVDVLTGLFLGVPSNGAESIELTSDVGATETFTFCELEFLAMRRLCWVLLTIGVCRYRCGTPESVFPDRFGSRRVRVC
jgi:hypothetical protein